MALDPQIVTDIAPQFTDTTRIALFLAKAERRHNTDGWGNVYADAMAAYAAHLMTRFPAAAGASAVAAGAAGPLTSRTAGDVSETYGSVNGSGFAVGSDADLKTTTYGLEYMALRDTRVGATPTIIDVNALD